MIINCLGLVTSALLFASGALAEFDMSRNDNVAVYWGQNSHGAGPGEQKSIKHYCEDDAIDTIPVAFLTKFFSDGGLPEINLSNIYCPFFEGTRLFDCSERPNLGGEIEFCQHKGKIVTLSLGGAGADTIIKSDEQAKALATTIWNLFLNESSKTLRPFGRAVLDGVDFDIEGRPDKEQRHRLAILASHIRLLTKDAKKKYYLTAAPQCPFPDRALGSVIDEVGFDAIYVQFYNNPGCGLTSDPTPHLNFDTWDDWAKNKSPNKNVKIYIGAPAAKNAAGTGYVEIDTLKKIALATRQKFPSSFGGVMLWDASQAVANNRYDLAIKDALKTGGSSTPFTYTTAFGGSFGGVSAWVSNVGPNGGAEVTFNGNSFQAKWWSDDDTPRGAAGGFDKSLSPVQFGPSFYDSETNNFQAPLSGYGRNRCG